KPVFYAGVATTLRRIGTLCPTGSSRSREPKAGGHQAPPQPVRSTRWERNDAPALRENDRKEKVVKVHFSEHRRGVLGTTSSPGGRRGGRRVARLPATTPPGSPARRDRRPRRKAARDLRRVRTTDRSSGRLAPRRTLAARHPQRRPFGLQP